MLAGQKPDKFLRLPARRFQLVKAAEQALNLFEEEHRNRVRYGTGRTFIGEEFGGS